MTILQKKNIFLHNHPKNTIFLGFFWNCLFPFFHVFSFSFSNIKKTKTKSAHFFSKTLFWHLDKLPKKYFRTPTHYLCFLRYPRNTIKLGKNKQKKILDHILTQPWTTFCLKKTQILDHILSLQHIYIYTHGNSLLKYTEGRDKTSLYSYLVVILLNWVPDNWVYHPVLPLRPKQGIPL